MSSFKCGHDAPIYGVIEGIIEKSGTPYFSFKDLDENKPSGSIRIRVETIDYFLRRYREDVIKRREKELDIQAKLAEIERELLERRLETLQAGSRLGAAFISHVGRRFLFVSLGRPMVVRSRFWFELLIVHRSVAKLSA